MNVKQVFKKAALCFAVAGMMNSYSALAGPALLSSAQLNFNGTVVASACTVSTGSKTVNVDLGGGSTIEASTLADPGNATNWENITLSMTNCPATTTAITAKFSGNRASEGAHLYESNGAADFVQIELTTKPATGGAALPLGDGATHEVLVDHGTNSATFNLQARAFTTQGGVTPGDIKGAVQVGFTYR